jgi:hypothetical protein
VVTLRALESLPGSLWVLTLIQAAFVSIAALTGNILNVRFHLVRRREDPRSFRLWLWVWIATTAAEVLAATLGTANNTLSLPFQP